MQERSYLTEHLDNPYVIQANESSKAFYDLVDGVSSKTNDTTKLLAKLYTHYGEGLDVAPDLEVDHQEWAEFIDAQSKAHKILYNILWSMK